MRIAVIIPALNEAAYLEKTLQSVQREQPYGCWVVDGGSHDDTLSLAGNYASVLTAPTGRAHQMNAGAAAALEAEVFLFLHADTLLPTGALQAITEALADPTVGAGTFRLQFDVETPLLQFYSFCTHLPWHRICFGDRGLFIRKSHFEAVGGFPAWPIFEDLEMVRRLRAETGFAYLPLAVTTAARRFLHYGTIRQQLRNLYLWSRYQLGASPDQLTHLYRYD